MKGEEYRDCNIIGISRTQNQQELAMIYSMSDVFVNPTHADMFPTVNLEALACGTPVVTYNAGGSPEILDENTGMVVQRDDISALHEAINHIIAKGKQCYSDACRSRAIKNFNKNERFEDYISLYEELAKK